MSVVSLDPILGRHHSKAVPSWALVGVLVVTVVERLLAGAPLQGAFAAVAVAIALLPPVHARDPAVMAAWPVLALLTLPAVGLAVDAFVEPATYLAVATLGLLVVAEIDQFSQARMPGWFAAGMVVMATMTVASAWTIVRYGAGRWLGFGYATSVGALMWDLVVATAVGIGAGALFEFALHEREETTGDR